METESDRLALVEPLKGYYFVIDTAVLWNYNQRKGGWVQITDKPVEVNFVGTEFPALGQANKMYANTTEGNEHIAIWSEELGTYVVVADKTHSMTSEDVIEMFKK